MGRTKFKIIKYVGLSIFTFALIFNISVAQAAYSADTLVTFTNAARAENGLGALSTNNALGLAALAKAQDILAKDYFAHNSPDGKTPWDFINESGYTYVYAGENLAIGYTDTSELFTAWMNSPTHRENIVNPNFREIGVAVVSGEFQGAETTVVVQEFGARDANVSSQVAATTPQPATSASPQATSTPMQTQSFTFVKDKSGITPKIIFSGEEVEIRVTLSGEIKTLSAEIFDQKYNLLETGSATGSGQEKTYVLKQKIEKVGSSEVKVTAVDQNGHSETLNLGILETKETVIAKASTENKTGLIAGFEESVRNNWAIYLIVSAFVLIGIVFYIVWRKHRFNTLASSWRF